MNWEKYTRIALDLVSATQQENRDRVKRMALIISLLLKRSFKKWSKEMSSSSTAKFIPTFTELPNHKLKEYKARARYLYLILMFRELSSLKKHFRIQTSWLSFHLVYNLWEKDLRKEIQRQLIAHKLDSKTLLVKLVSCSNLEILSSTGLSIQTFNYQARHLIL